MKFDLNKLNSLDGFDPIIAQQLGPLIANLNFDDPNIS